MAAQNQAVVVKAFDATSPTGGASLQPHPVADPGAGEVQVHMKYAGVNPADVLSFMGFYPGFTTKLPGVPGSDGALVACLPCSVQLWHQQYPPEVPQLDVTRM
jgi:NADPH:quinone reductase-like Zn-dependent oxidoreductase